MSKGITDLPGIGKLFGEFRKLLMDLLRYRSEREARRLRDEEQALKNEQVALKNHELRIKNRCAELQLAEKLLTASKKKDITPQEFQHFITSLTPLQEPQPIAQPEYLPPSQVSHPLPRLLAK